jgi:hypothetical protein
MDSELKQYLDEFSERFRQIDVQFQQMREENAAAHDETRNLLRGEIVEAVSTLRRESEAMHEETRRILRAESVTAHEETRRHFDVMVEGMESRFGLLAEHVQTVDRDVAEIKRRTR